MNGRAALTLSEKELKLTAALYTKLHGVLEYVRATGQLPQDMKPKAYYCIPMRLLIEERGTDIALSSDEALVYDAIVRAGRTPGGAVNLVEEREDGGGLVAPVAPALGGQASESARGRAQTAVGNESAATDNEETRQ